MGNESPLAEVPAIYLAGMVKRRGYRSPFLHMERRRRELPDMQGARQDQGEAEEERKEVMGPNWPVIGVIASIATVVAVPFGMWQDSLAAGAAQSAAVGAAWSAAQSAAQSAAAGAAWSAAQSAAESAAREQQADSIRRYFPKPPKITKAGAK